MIPPVLHTERLSLGPLTMTRFAGFVGSAHARFIGGPGDRAEAWSSALTHAGQWQARGYGAFWASETATGAPVGRPGLWHPPSLPEPELARVVYEAHTRRGYAVEAARAVRSWAAAQGLAGLWSLIRPDNAASLGVARRLGAVLEGVHAHAHGGTAEIWRHPRGAA